MQIATNNKRGHDLPPYGWWPNRNGRIAASKKEQAVIGRMQLWRNHGLSNDAIAYRLNEQKVPTRTGRPWSATAVQLILKHVAERMGK